jgi:hypothetical protein
MARIFFTTRPVGPVQKLLSIIVGLGVLALGLMFSAVLLVVGVVVGLIVVGYLWWKTRELRRAMRDTKAGAYRPPPPTCGEIIEGEAVRVEEEVLVLDRQDDDGQR